MSASNKSTGKRIRPRLARGFRDIFGADAHLRQELIKNVRAVYERYGFTPLETPAVEYVDVLGKVLPESDQPDAGLFALKDDADEWVALRPELTASLARVVAQYAELPRPFRRYQFGSAWRMEKPGPGRFREFLQFDFDTVGTTSMMADAETCCVMADALEAAGLRRGEYVIRVNHRKILSGVLDSLGLGVLDSRDEQSVPLNVLRSIDKLDRLGLGGVRQLLGKGRMDETGDFTKGVDLPTEQIARIEEYLGAPAGASRDEICAYEEKIVGESTVGHEGIADLREMDRYLVALGYQEDRVRFDPTLVRGLSYYTGPVFEAVLTVDAPPDSPLRQLGSIFGGGRYDGLVKRFTGQEVPATGASIGLDRVLAALRLLERVGERPSTAEVLVTAMDKNLRGEYMVLAQQLRDAGINAELFVGGGGIGRQMKHADKCGIPLAVIIGSDEHEQGQVPIKDMQLGAELAAGITDRDEWRKGQPAQETIPRTELIDNLKRRLART